MKKYLLLLFILTGIASYSQERNDQSPIDDLPVLFRDQGEPLALRLRFSAKDVRRNTNDSTYLLSSLWYKKNDGSWDSLGTGLRARGNFRRNNCNYVPLKLKLKKSDIAGTIFEGTPKLKVVLPCLAEKNTNDLVLKEYLAYQFFELISPYHFKTRLAILEYQDERNSRIRSHHLKTILIEDMDQVAQRYNGREMTRAVHPMQQDALASLQNSLFQFLIGNTDFSTRGEHNVKLLFADNKYVSLPYDFDMSGLVNASYATISGLENSKARISHVTERVYKGYKRDASLLQKVRREFIAHKNEIFGLTESLKGYFDSPAQYQEAREYIADFFRIMENDDKFQRYIVSSERDQ